MRRTEKGGERRLAISIATFICFWSGEQMSGCSLAANRQSIPRSLATTNKPEREENGYIVRNVPAG